MERSYGKEHADGIVAVCHTHRMLSRRAKIGKGSHSKCMGEEQHEEIEKGHDERDWLSVNKLCFTMHVWSHSSFDHCTLFYLLINPNC